MSDQTQKTDPQPPAAEKKDAPTQPQPAAAPPPPAPSPVQAASSPAAPQAASSAQAAPPEFQAMFSQMQAMFGQMQAVTQEFTAFLQGQKAQKSAERVARLAAESFINPEDATLYLSEAERNDPDDAKIVAALNAALDKRPHLRKKPGSVDGGAPPPASGTASDSGGVGLGRITAAYGAAGNKK